LAGVLIRGNLWVLVLGLALLAVSAVLLTVGAELFAEHAAGAGRRIGVTALAIGLVVAGAEPEEMVTAAIASARHHPGIALGDALGANVTMLTLVLGSVAVLVGVPLSARVRGYAIGASLVGLLCAIFVTTGQIDRVAGGVLILAYAVLVGVIWTVEREPPAIGEVVEAYEELDAGVAAGASASAVVLVLIGVALMVVGGIVAVAGAERVVDTLGIADSAVGLTLVALATTAELFALAWAALRRGITELAVAGVVGSAAYNATATVGVAAVIRPLPSHGITGAAWLAAALPLVVVALGGPKARVRRLSGVGLLAIYGIYLFVIFR
jgi:cation:H+ antiporter